MSNSTPPSSSSGGYPKTDPVEHGIAASGAASNGVPDVNAIMAQIRAEVRKAVAEDKASYPKYVPPEQSNRPAGQTLIEFEELSYLNQHWNDWSSTEHLSSHRPIVGRFIVRAKQFILNVVWQYILKGYLDRERQFQMQLVRFLNDNARYVDRRDYEIFWQLIKKIDSDVAALNERTDRLFKECLNTIEVLESRLEKVQSRK